MRQHLWSILFLVICLTAVLVKSESFTEVDDDGNEIEVKRFYIEGRQLNGGRRQCYETRRRKRSYAYGQEEDKSNDEILTATSTAPSGIDTAVSIDEEDDMEEDKPVGVYGIRQGADNGEQNMADDGADENEKEDEDEAVLNLPVVAQITHQSNVQSTPAAVDSNQNGIVIVQGNMPPKVDPQTHAVFELLPVENGEDGDDGLDGVDYGDDSHLLYQEEISPVSTTAIWSTGDDEPLKYGQTELETDTEDYADIDEGQNGTAKPKPSKRPTKRPTKKPSKKPSRKPSRRPVKKRPNNKRPNTSSSKRRRPSKRNKNSSHRRGTSNNKRRRPHPNYDDDDLDGFRLTANRLKNHKLDNLKYKRKQLNKENEANQGTNTFTKTETFTRTGTSDDEKNVNCIIINKTTTPRPFWGLFGRSADGDEAEATTAKPYGRRKRINFSLPA
ncbi:PREDICTED: circumsporozoite protein [Bactrocera latifrons]|nr:PREDICTED: circumsporozoite protein [Bactrocera latifrons]